MTIAEAIAFARGECEAGNLSGAEVMCRQILLSESQCVEALALLAFVCGVQGRFQESLALCQQALQINPSLAEVHRNMGGLFAAQGAADEAVTAFRSALEVQPNDAVAWNGLGLVHARLQQRLDDAVRCFQQALALAPEYSQARNNLGNTLLMQRRPAEAADCYRESLRRRPDDADAHSNLAVACWALEQWDEAIASWRRSLEINPNDARTHRNFGNALLLQHRPAEALPHFRQVLVVNPNDVHARVVVDVLGGTASWTQLPADYVVSVFDRHAATFDQHLVENLAYRGPALLQAALGTPPGPHSLDILDLGCGTGLCGAAFRDWARTLVGVDLSAQMLDKARARGIYDRLIQSDLLPALADARASFDLVLAGDVLIYLGELAPLFTAVRQALRPGGRFAFTVELAEGTGYRVLPTIRFAHSRAYLHELATRTQMREISIQDTVLRREHKQEVAALVIVLGAAV
jgi:predicted TPR repeat methyltransferase